MTTFSKAGVPMTTSELEQRIAVLEQALWDCAGEAGADLDGMPTPAALKQPSVEEFALQAVRDLRQCYDAELRREI